VSGSSTEAQIRLLLVEDMPQVANYIRSLLDTQTKIKLLEVVRDGRQVLDQIREHQPDVLIVDALLQGRINGLAVAQEVREAGLDLPIIALTVPQKPVKVGEGMGATAVISMPFSGFDFMRLLQDMHEAQRARAPESLSRVYSFFGAKGGVGTSTLAYNVAAAIAAMHFRVALIDGSLQFGDIRALLRVTDDVPSIVQLPTTHIQRGDLEQVMYRDGSGVEVLLAPPRIEMAEMVTPRDIERLLSLMRKIYNVVIIDTATTVDDMVLAYLDNSDGLVQVVTNEWTSLQRARAMSETMTAINFSAERIRYLVNRSDSTGGLPRDAIAQTLGRDPDFGVVSDGKLVLEANNRGRPFSSVAPDAPITRDIARIAADLTRTMGPGPTPSGQAAAGVQ
jgi:MinD-like ATPase involved in chromosome partitioning or flagellar assembly/ActR/RegA family two-component response regulator